MTLKYVPHILFRLIHLLSPYHYFVFFSLYITNIFCHTVKSHCYIFRLIGSGEKLGRRKFSSSVLGITPICMQPTLTIVAVLRSR